MSSHTRPASPQSIPAVWLQIGLVAVSTLCCSQCVSGGGPSAIPFEIPDWKAQPARRTPWTRWLNTFDFRNGAGDPDFYRGSGFMVVRPSNYRTTAEGRFGMGAPVFTVRDHRTQMTYRMGSNCPTYQGTVELFVRSRPGSNIWNDGRPHHVLHLYGPRGVGAEGRPSMSLIKTGSGTLEFVCQGTRLRDPVDRLEEEGWHHLAISWDTKNAPGQVWLTVNGKGVTSPAWKRLQPLSYECLLVGNSPRETDRVFERDFGDWPANWPRLHQDSPNDKDVLPLEGIVDEIHIRDETLADRLPSRRTKLECLPVDWGLYQEVEDMVRLFLYHSWPNHLPVSTQLGGKYGGVSSVGWFHSAMYEAYGDIWFLDQAERVGQVGLMAQRPEGHFPTAVKFISGDRSPHEIRRAETGLARVEPADWSDPTIMRIQDGFQDGVVSFLVCLYRLTGRVEYLNAARKTADLLIKAQNPNGSWSGEYDVETGIGHIADNKEIFQGGEFDDGGIRRPFWALILMYQVTKDERYLVPLIRCADWVLDAEIVGSGARGWAGFYDADNRPVQARVHEYPKISSKVLPQDVGHLMIWAFFLTGDERYLERIRPAVEWYRKHRDPGRGWPAFYENDGTPFAPSNWYSATGWYGPQYGHFQDINYIEEALASMEKDELKPAKGTLEAAPEAMNQAVNEALNRLRDTDLLRWIRRDVQLIPRAEWVPNRSRYEPHLYGLQIGGHARLDLMVEYLLSVRIVASKVPPRVFLTGAPTPSGAPVSGLPARCWFVDNWFDTPLRQKAGKK